MIATSEYELVTESAGLVDRSARAMFVVRGAEAADFLQGQVSNDVEGIAPGQGCYATILNHKGKLRTDLRILRGDDLFWLDTRRDRRTPCCATCSHLLARPRRALGGHRRRARADPVADRPGAPTT